MPDTAIQQIPADRELEIGTVQRADHETLAELSQLLPQLSRTAQPLTLEKLSEIITHDSTTLLVARLRGRLVGTLTLVTFPLPSGLRAWIEDVVVDEAARGAGVGAALVGAALEQAQTYGARTVDLTSRPSREAANRLYLRMGFQLRESNVYRYSASSAW